MKRSLALLIMLVLITAVAGAADNQNTLITFQVDGAAEALVMNEGVLHIDDWNSLIPKHSVIEYSGEACEIRDIYSNGAMESRETVCIECFSSGKIFFDLHDSRYIIVFSEGTGL